jgi:hypothetical protein
VLGTHCVLESDAHGVTVPLQLPGPVLVTPQRQPGWLVQAVCSESVSQLGGSPRHGTVQVQVLLTQSPSVVTVAQNVALKEHPPSNQVHPGVLPHDTESLFRPQSIVTSPPHDPLDGLHPLVLEHWVAVSFAQAVETPLQDGCGPPLLEDDPEPELLVELLPEDDPELELLLEVDPDEAP